jgi:hypothetical protein
VRQQLQGCVMLVLNTFEGLVFQYWNKYSFFQAVENVLSIGKQFPINTHGDAVLNYDCFCTHTNGSSFPENFNWTDLNKEECLVSLY